MASKSRAPKGGPRKRAGRPPKPPEDVASRVMTLRLTDEDRAALLALLDDDRAKLEAGPMGSAASKFAAVDVIRNLIRQEVQRRGLAPGA